MKWSYEDLKSFAAARCIDLFKSVKPQDVKALPESAQALWKIGWEMSAQTPEGEKMSMLDRKTFEDDGYNDGRNGKRPDPPDDPVFKKEYMNGWDAGNHEYALEQAHGIHGQG